MTLVGTTLSMDIVRSENGYGSAKYIPSRIAFMIEDFPAPVAVTDVWASYPRTI